MANSRVSRGRRTQLKVAEWFKSHGWEGAENTLASLPGKDVKGMPGWAPEVKATRDGSLTGAMKQALKNASPGEVPFVVWRPDGYGEERMREWLCVFTLGDATAMMRELEGFDRDDDGSPSACACGEGEYFDRSFCPEPCGSMHYRCEGCGRATDECEFESRRERTRPMQVVLRELAAELQRAIEEQGAA